MTLAWHLVGVAWRTVVWVFAIAAVLGVLSSFGTVARAYRVYPPLCLATPGGSAGTLRELGEVYQTQGVCASRDVTLVPRRIERAPSARSAPFRSPPPLAYAAMPVLFAVPFALAVLVRRGFRRLRTSLAY